MKILIYATAPKQPIGYAKIANRISNYLAEQSDIEVYYLGIHNYVDQEDHDRFVHPKINFIDCIEEEKKAGFETDYGVKIIESVLNRIKPDVFLIYNDIIVTCRLFNELLNYRENNRHITKFITYIDLVYPYEKLEFVQHLDKNSDLIFVFSECWKRNLVNMGVVHSKIKILYHGINTDLVKPVPKELARKHFNIGADDFVLLNINRNAYRKAWDITIGAFIKFLKSENMNPSIKLFVNCLLTSSSGYDILSLIKIECLKNGVLFDDVQKHILTLPTKIGYASDNDINLLYNATDVGLNTCIGEGFGLCNTEHALLGRPQVVSAVCALKDIFTNDYSYLVEPRVTVQAANQLDGHNGDISFCSQDDFADGMSFYFHNRDKLREHGIMAAEIIRNKYDWSVILPKFIKDLRDFMTMIF